MKAPVLRFRIDPGDIPPEKAARRLHLTLAEFQCKLPELMVRGFPEPDPTTGMFDLQAIDEWRRRRNPTLFGLTAAPDRTETPPKQKTLGEMFRDKTKVGGRDG